MTAPDPAADRTGLWLVILIIGMLLVWAATANLLGGAIGFTTALAVGAIGACVGWRDKITYDVLSNIGLIGVPVLVVGLSLS